MTETKKRIEWIDMAKGYGILAVIIAHLNVGTLGMWIYTFHIPLFFVLSGYLFHAETDFKTFVYKKVKSMLVPYFCLGLPMLLFNGLGHYVMDGYSFQECIALFLDFIVQRRMWTLWFLACLFMLRL